MENKKLYSLEKKKGRLFVQILKFVVPNKKIDFVRKLAEFVNLEIESYKLEESRK